MPLPKLGIVLYLLKHLNIYNKTKNNMCKCGCDSCGVNTTPLMLNESLAPKQILSEGLKHHMDNNKPLTEHLYRAGSTNYFNLWAEARSLYSREILEITNEDDLAVLTETHLGHFGILEDGTKVPLDFPIELNEDMDIEDEIANMEFGMDYDQLNPGEKEWVRDEIDNMSLNEVEEKFKVIDTKTGDIIDSDLPKRIAQKLAKNKKEWTSYPDREKSAIAKIAQTLDEDMDKYKVIDIKTGDIIDSDLPKNIAQKLAKKKKEWTSYPDREESVIAKIAQTLDEAKDKPLNKPMRDTSGGKAYKVYVKDPKTKKIKTVRFGSGGLRAKINDKEARNAFAARHKCSTKKDKTKAGYWSCRLPRYAKLLGLKSSFTGFW
jgi:hypothetical protein